MEFEFDNNLPIYIQLVDNLKILIISGEIAIGERLPSVREMAFMTKVNPNTVQKALNELEDLGLVYTERTNGKFVTNDYELINKYKERYMENLTNDYFESMKEIGLKKEEIIKYIKEKV